MADVFDLFGNPVDECHGRRGRPPYQPTTEDRNKIKLSLALGKSIAYMANAIGVSPATVKRYFRAELKSRHAMRDRMDAAYAAKLWDGVVAGNAAAQRLWMVYLDRNDRMEAEASMAALPADRPAADRIGKKVVEAQLAIDADADLMAELDREATAQNVIN